MHASAAQLLYRPVLVCSFHNGSRKQTYLELAGPATELYLHLLPLVGGAVVVQRDVPRLLHHVHCRPHPGVPQCALWHL